MANSIGRLIIARQNGRRNHKRTGQRLVQTLFWIWLAGALLFASASVVSGRRDSEAGWALAILGWVFWPIMLVGVALYVAWERFGRR